MSPAMTEYRCELIQKVRNHDVQQWTNIGTARIQLNRLKQAIQETEKRSYEK